MNSLVITQCTVKKNEKLYKGPACNMYAGKMFSYLMRRATEFQDDVVIISAKYGLLYPSDIIDNYNRVLKTAADIKELSLKVLPKLSELLRSNTYEHIYIALSNKYKKVISSILQMPNIVILKPDNWGYLFTKFDGY